MPNVEGASPRRLFSLLLLALLALLVAAPVGLGGCRKTEPPGQGQAGGSGGAGGSGIPLQVSIYDQRRLYPRTGMGSFQPSDFLETRVSSGQDVLIGEGNFIVTIGWFKKVSPEAARASIVLDPPPAGDWSWEPQEVPTSTLQLFYREDQWSVPKVNVTLKGGMPLGPTETLAQDFTFTVTRAKEPTMTASVTGFPWVKIPTDRVVEGYVLPAGRHELRLEFSAAPDHQEAEEALIGSVPGVIESRWADDRTFIVTLDLVDGEDPVVLNINGVAVPGGLRFSHIDPLALAGKAPVGLACYEDPDDLAAGPRLTELPLPLGPGRVAIGGERVLLLEDVRSVDVAYDSPWLYPIPWVVDTRTGDARCLEGPFETDPIAMGVGMYGWAADGRLALPLWDGSTVLIDPGAADPAEDAWRVWAPPKPQSDACLTRSVSPDGRRLALLELADAYDPNDSTMRLVLMDLATAQRTADYPAAGKAVLYDGEYWQRPPLLWSPDGGLWLPADETLPAAQFRMFDQASGTFVTRDFTAPDGKPLKAFAWTVHSGPADWLANGRAVGFEAANEQLLLVSASGRKQLGLTDGNPGPLMRAAFSPDGSLLAVQSGTRAFLFRCPSGEKARDIEGQFVGFSAGGQLWVLVPAEGN